MRALSRWLIGSMLTLTASCSNQTVKETSSAKAENATPKPATEKLQDVSHLLVINDAFAIENVGFWSENLTIKGLPMLSDTGEHMLRLQFNSFETEFAPSGEEAEPIGEFVIEKVRLSDLSVVQTFPLLSKKEILQAHRDARTQECVEKSMGAGEEGDSGVADCPIDPKRAAAVIATTKTGMLKQASIAAAELSEGKYTSMMTVSLKDPPAGEDGEEVEPPKNPDPERVYTVKVALHRPTVRVLRKRDNKVIGEVTLQCVALPETSCTLGDHLELFSDAKGTKVVVTGREVDLENGKVLGKVVKVIPLKTVP